MTARKSRQAEGRVRKVETSDGDGDEEEQTRTRLRAPSRSTVLVAHPAAAAKVKLCTRERLLELAVLAVLLAPVVLACTPRLLSLLTVPLPRDVLVADRRARHEPPLRAERARGRSRRRRRRARERAVRGR